MRIDLGVSGDAERGEALSNAERQKRYRERNAPLRKVTKSNEYRNAKEFSPQTPLSESKHLSNQDQAQTEPDSGSGVRTSHLDSVRASGAGVTESNVTRNVTDDSETVVPLNLVAKAIERGVLSDMLDHMPGVTREQLEEKAREFVTYWTIGAGAGKRRRNWMAKLREDLRRAFHENRLKAPGFIEHAERSGRTMREAESPAPKKPDPWAWQWAPGGPLFGKPRPTTGPESDPNRRTNGQKSYR